MFLSSATYGCQLKVAYLSGFFTYTTLTSFLCLIQMNLQSRHKVCLSNIRFARRLVTLDHGKGGRQVKKRKIHLETRMEQYAATAQAQIVRRHTIGELAGYAAAVGAGFALASTADAAIVYSGALNHSVSIPPSVNSSDNVTSLANIDGIKVSGHVALQSSNPNGQKYSLGGTVNHIGIANIGANSGMKLLGPSINKYHVSGHRLAKSSLISSGAQFGAVNAGWANAVQTSGAGGVTSASRGFFLPGNAGFAGFKLPNGDLGWIQLQVDSSGGFPDKLTLIDWAYNDIRGASILAGQTSGPTRTVPDPSSLALLAAGALGLVAFRRRKAARAN